MTVTELRNHPEYKLCFDKIKAYSKGFEFKLNYAQIPPAKANGLKFIMRDAIEQGLIECISTGWSLEGKIVDETFRKL